MKLTAPVTGGPCWAELGTTDVDGAKTFYTRLFGWLAETDTREQAGGYTVARLGDAPVAALTPLFKPSQPVAWNVSFAVTDAEACLRAVRHAGGTRLLGPMEVFDLGRFAVIADPDGAVFHLWEPGTFPGAGVFNAPGALGWVELLTRAPEQAVAFYTTVFGWSVDPAQRYPQWGIDGAGFGGMTAMDDTFPPEVPSHWLPYFAAEDVGETAAAAARDKGTVLMEPTTVPDGPRIAVLHDPQGAVFGVYAADHER
ncbi:VOC family protein [Streptomyces thermocarboxydovorans]|uniref:VOC family protein n=1 Tax=Streptomyces thermocarboxydovorans TaxID=59298 RepID=A0ABP3SB93_9ACTN